MNALCFFIMVSFFTSNLVLAGREIQRTPLQKAIASQNMHEFKRLLEEGQVDVNAEGPYGKGALHEAAIYDNSEAIEALLDHGARIDQQSQDQATALYYAVSYGKIKAAQTLLERGANVNFRSGRTGKTPLHLSVEQDSAAFVELLLEKGGSKIDIVSYDANECAILHTIASRPNKAALLKVLLAKRKDIDLNIKDYRRQTPLQIALHHGNDEVLKLLREHKAKMELGGKEKHNTPSKIPNSPIGPSSLETSDIETLCDEDG